MSQDKNISRRNNNSIMTTIVESLLNPYVFGILFASIMGIYMMIEHPYWFVGFGIFIVLIILILVIIKVIIEIKTLPIGLFRGDK